MAPLLSCQSISKSYGDRPLFAELSCSIAERDRLGILGPNGAGKSTLLKIMAHQEEADRGEIVTTRGLRVAYLAQQEIFDEDRTVEEIVAEALEPGDLDEDEARLKCAKAISLFGFESPSQQVRSLSGGWRKRLSIASAIAKEPNLLIMDEPTNHLDLEGIAWLEQYLQVAPFAIVLVSHDRVFLENVTNRTLEINRLFPGGYYMVDGNYSQFLEKRAEALNAMRRQEESLANRVRREIEWLRRGPKARATKADARIQEAHRLIDNLQESRGRLQNESAAQIEFSASGRKSKRLIAAEGISKSLGGKLLFKDLSFVLSPKVRVGLLGENGSGKTTLLNILAGRMEVDSGLIEFAPQLRVVMFDQARTQLDRDVSLSRMLAPDSDTVVFQDRALHVASYASRFGFYGKSLQTPVGSLSGGEQARVLIAHLMLQRADVLVLDEPTNDLDIDTLEVLEESLEDFPGAVVLVTHDRMMLDRISNVIIGLDGEGACSLYADHSQWLAARRARSLTKQDKGNPRRTSDKPATRKLSYQERKEISQMEGRIEQAESQLEASRLATLDPAIATDAAKLTAACEGLAQAQERVDALYARWAELETIRGSSAE